VANLHDYEVKFRCIKCGICCAPTEMELLPDDIERIESLGYRFEDFAEVRDDGTVRLRNVDGHCVFYDPASRSCKIYEHRPIGCRLYPVIYVDGSVGVDKLCPTWYTVRRSELKRLEPLVRDFVNRAKYTSVVIKLRFGGEPRKG